MEYIIVMHSMRRKDKNGQQMKHKSNQLCCVVKKRYYFHTLLWFLASDRDFRRFESDFRCGKNRIDHGCPCATEFTRMSLHSTEITRYCSRFLQYKLIVWTPLRTGADDGFSYKKHRWCPGIVTYTSCHWHLLVERDHHSNLRWLLGGWDDYQQLFLRKMHL